MSLFRFNKRFLDARAKDRSQSPGNHSSEVLRQPIARLKSQKLAAGINHRALQDLKWMSEQGRPYDSARLWLQLIKGAHLFERAVPAPFQIVMSVRVVGNADSASGATIQRGGVSGTLENGSGARAAGQVVRAKPMSTLDAELNDFGA